MTPGIGNSATCCRSIYIKGTIGSSFRTNDSIYQMWLAMQSMDNLKSAHEIDEMKQSNPHSYHPIGLMSSKEWH